MKTLTRKSLEKQGYTFYGDETLLNSFPKIQKGTIELFTIGKYVSDDQLEKEYQKRGLIPLDPISLTMYLQDTSILDNKKYIATHWKNADGKWCYIAFSPWGGGKRSVGVGQSGYDWDDDWSFAGVRKVGSQFSEPQISLDSLNLELCIEKIKAEGYVVYKPM